MIPNLTDEPILQVDGSSTHWITIVTLIVNSKQVPQLPPGQERPLLEGASPDETKEWEGGRWCACLM